MKIDGMKNNVGMRASIPEMRKDLRGSVTPMKTADMPRAMADPFLAAFLDDKGRQSLSDTPAGAFRAASETASLKVTDPFLAAFTEEGEKTTNGYVSTADFDRKDRETASALAKSYRQGQYGPAEQYQPMEVTKVKTDGSGSSLYNALLVDAAKSAVIVPG